jgi:hypothetical protein
MPPRPNARKWNDIQAAIATVGIVATLGMWNLFATPAKTKVVQTQEPVVPPTEPPTEAPVAAAPTRMPHIKIMFTQLSPQTAIIQQTQNQQVQTQTKKKKKNNGGSNSGGGGGTVTQTKSS